MNNELPDDDTKTVKFLLKEDLARFKVTFIYRKFINSYTDKFIILETRYIYIYI